MGVRFTLAISVFYALYVEFTIANPMTLQKNGAVD